MHNDGFREIHTWLSFKGVWVRADPCQCGEFHDHDTCYQFAPNDSKEHEIQLQREQSNDASRRSQTNEIGNEKKNSNEEEHYNEKESKNGESKLKLKGNNNEESNDKESNDNF